jgi:hypothetical protein
MPRFSRLSLALLAVLCLGFAGSARATSFSLGHVSGPFSFSVMNGKLTGPFVDKFHFIIDPGVSLIFTADFNLYSFRHWDIADLDGTLSDASGVILNGDASSLDEPSGYPRRLVTFPSLQLGPGHYFVSIFGHAFSDVGATIVYSGTIQLARTPIPTSLLMLLTALGASCWLVWLRFPTRSYKPDELVTVG